jgi:hypothetical protein
MHRWRRACHVRDAQPLDGPLPRLDVSDAYLPAK